MSFKYTWTARDQSGQKIVKEVEAESARAAQEILLAAGYSDLELKEDGLMTTAQAGFSKKIRPTTKQRVQKLDNPSGTTWEILKPRFIDGIPFLFPFFLVPAYLFYRRDFLVGTLVVVVLVLLFGAHLIPALQLIYYRKLIKATDWYRWRKALFLITVLRIFGRMGAVKMPETELTRYRAKVLTGLGNLERALGVFAQCEGKPDCPGWLYKLSVAGLYGISKQHEKAIELNLMAIAENPNPTAWYDLANRYARYKRDAAKAREALTEAEKSPVVAYAKPFQARCRGIIAYLEGDYSTSRIELETAISLLEQPKWRPFRDGHLAIARAYLCCVLAKQEDTENAKKNLDQAMKYLVATQEDELLAECRNSIGIS